MTVQQRRLTVENRRQVSRRTLATARLAFSAGDWRSAASRAYYAAYQAATSLCIEHGDEGRFPSNWNNPTHDQLPELIDNNGDLTIPVRWRATQLLVALRVGRESADYRPGRTIDESNALESLQQTILLFNLLEVGLYDGKNG